jgi:hypothetical protein
MVNTSANARRTGIVSMACIAAITALAVVGCSGSTDSRIDELVSRGFSDIATVDGDLYDHIAVYYATVDDCRIKMTFSSLDDTWTGRLAIIDGQTIELEEPSASSVRNNPSFSYCTTPSAD